jgi:nuclear polyadenylated RNA-binding protein NAB2
MPPPVFHSFIDATFTTWLFSEAAKGGSEPEVPPAEPLPQPQPEVAKPPPARDPPPHIVGTSQPRRGSQGGRNGVYQQALSQALPSSGQKRSASARSPSPNSPNKIRRTDLPTGPRAMQHNGPSNSRSLLERVGGHANKRDEIQARIDTITNNPPVDNMMMGGGFPGMGNMPPGMDMNAMAMANPMMLQEIMMNQMALMAQITGMMGPNQFPGGPGFPMQNGFGGGNNGHQNNAGRGRGRGGRGGRGRGGHSGGHNRGEEAPKDAEHTPVVEAPAPVVVAPTPVAAPQPTSATATGRPGFVVPERPLSPTLCKFASKCTNAHCRYSHPSPVATVESGMVLSNDPCEQGKDCKDKDCVKSHVSPAVLNPKGELSGYILLKLLLICFYSR